MTKGAHVDCDGQTVIKRANTILGKDVLRDTDAAPLTQSNGCGPLPRNHGIQASPGPQNDTPESWNNPRVSRYFAPSETVVPEPSSSPHRLSPRPQHDEDGRRWYPVPRRPHSTNSMQPRSFARQPQYMGVPRQPILYPEQHQRLPQVPSLVVVSQVRTSTIILERTQ